MNWAIFLPSVLHVALYKTVFFNFWFRPPNAQNLLSKICTKSPISRLVWQIDRRCLGLPGGFWGWPIQWNHAECCGADHCCHGNEIWLGAEIQSLTGLFLVLVCASVLDFFSCVEFCGCMYNCVFGQNTEDRLILWIHVWLGSVMLRRWICNQEVVGLTHASVTKRHGLSLCKNWVKTKNVMEGRGHKPIAGVRSGNGEECLTCSICLSLSCEILTLTGSYLPYFYPVLQEKSSNL